MTSLAAYFQACTEHPVLWLGLAVSIWGMAQFLEGVLARVPLRRQGRRVPLDTMMLGLAASVFFWVVAAHWPLTPPQVVGLWP